MLSEAQAAELERFRELEAAPDKGAAGGDRGYWPGDPKRPRLAWSLERQGLLAANPRRTKPAGYRLSASGRAWLRKFRPTDGQAAADAPPASIDDETAAARLVLMAESNVPGVAPDPGDVEALHHAAAMLRKAGGIPPEVRAVLEDLATLGPKRLGRARADALASVLAAIEKLGPDA